VARCPRCRDVHWLSGQTRFFDPDFGGLYHREFAPGVAQPIDVDPARLLGPTWQFEWWRVRDGGALDDLRLLADYDDLYRCGCGTPLAPVLRFRVAGDTATLTALDVHDARDEALPGEVDFAEAPRGLWTGDDRRYREALAELAAQPSAARAARLHAALVEMFAEPWRPDPPWTTLAAPMRCEACGDVRERELWMMLSNPSSPLSPHAAGRTGGTLRPGDRLVGDLGWLADDVDRGAWLRVRHPVSSDSIVHASSPGRWGCRCGAGPASYVVRFAREAGALRFEGATLRVVRGRGDLADVDFAESPALTRDTPATPWPRWRPASREEAIAALLREWRIDA
jgi:hypothetical protein